MLPERSLPPLFLLLLGLLAACDGAPDRKRPGSGTGSEPLAVDFSLRTDHFLGRAFVGDLLHLDLDGDGLEDLVQGNFGVRTLTVALGLPDGSFLTTQQLKTPGHAFRLCSGDFDGDGRPDIAVGCGDWIDDAAQVVSVYLQAPRPGELAPGIDFPLESDPKDLVAMPVGGRTGRGIPDELLVALRDERRVLRLELRAGVLEATGSLDSAALDPLGGAGGPFSLAAIDLGADGWMDLVVGEENPGFDRLVEYPRGPAGFGPAQLVYFPLERPVVDATGDVDGNGYDDLAVAQLEGQQVLLLAADASGLKTPHVIDFGGETTSVLFEDLDGDGLAEVMATVYFQESLQVRRGLAPFVWSEPEHYNVGTAPRAIGVLRLPGDDLPDLLCGNAQDLSLLQGVGAARFRAARGSGLMGLPPVAFDLADLDGDGDLDAAAVTRGQESLVILENRGGRLEALGLVPLAPSPLAPGGDLALGDLDGDGDSDLVVTLFDRDELWVLRNTGGPASLLEATPEVYAVGDGPLSVELGDVDGDGRLDAIVGNLLGRSVQVWRGSDKGFEPRVPALQPFAPLALLASDLDGDGRADVAATVRYEDRTQGVVVMSGRSDGLLVVERAFALDVDGGSLALGDLDGDGALDLVVGNRDTLSSQVVVLRQSGALDFELSTFDTLVGPGTVLVDDLDEDGRADLCVLSVEGELELLMGDGGGSFRPSEPHARGQRSCADGILRAALADLDGDRLPEVLMIDPAAPFLWCATNLSQGRARP